MGTRTSKKQLILECCGERHWPEVREAELRLIQQELAARLAGSRTSLSYIAGVLRQSGARVEYEDRYADPPMPEPYASRLEGMLRFQDLAGAEEALRSLDAVWREYRAAGDGRGASLVRKLALRGKQRAESLAANPRVREVKRREKREIASWFRVWLENPDLFFDWLNLRQATEEFRQLFPAAPPSGQSELESPEC